MSNRNVEHNCRSVCCERSERPLVPSRERHTTIQLNFSAHHTCCVYNAALCRVAASLRSRMRRAGAAWQLQRCDWTSPAAFSPAPGPSFAWLSSSCALFARPDVHSWPSSSLRRRSCEAKEAPSLLIPSSAQTQHFTIRPVQKLRRASAVRWRRRRVWVAPFSGRR